MSETRPYPVLPLLGRGLLAGAAAGLLTGLYALLLAEPLMDRAIELEEERSAAEAATAAAGDHAHEAEEVFSRGMQYFGLTVTSVVVGLAVGVFFAVAYALIHRNSPVNQRAWPRALTLAGAGFLALSLLPGLRYPATPPGVGDGDTVGQRQGLWLAAMLIGVLGLVLAYLVWRRLGAAAAPLRQLAVVGVVVATLAVLFLLPANPDAAPVPAKLLWDFRVLSIGGHALLWATLGATFGALGLRATTRQPIPG